VGQGDLNDGNPASPAISDDRLYLKGAKYLWCVAEKKTALKDGADQAGKK